MSEYTVEIDFSKWDAYREQIREKFENLGNFLNQFLGDRVVPRLQAESASQRRVRTGLYSGSWQNLQDTSSSAMVINSAFYWKFLEFGTSRGIRPVPVVGDVIQGNLINDLVEYLGTALVQA